MTFMLSLHELDRRFLQYSVRLGLPSELVMRVIHARRIAGNPGDWIKRRRKAKEIRTSSPLATLIDRNKGYHIFEKSLLPEILPAVTEAAQLAEAKLSTLSVEDA